MVARLDGSHKSTFLKNISSVANTTYTSLAVDYVEQRIYWVNPSNRSSKIWSASLIDGSGHRLQRLMHSHGQLYGVAVMEDFVGFTEKKLTAGSMHVVEKDNGREMTTEGIQHYRKPIYDITAYYKGNQPLYLGNTNTSCDLGNGGCKQLCFDLLTGRKCGCTDTMKVSADGVSCEPSLQPLNDTFFLIADDYRREIYQADENLKNIRALKFPQDDRPIGLTYDFPNGRVYWADFNSHYIKSMFLNGSDVKILIKEGKKSRTEGIAFDSASQILYYTDSGRDIIGMTNPSGRSRKVLVRGIKSPRAIVLDPQHGYLYVTSRQAGKGRILRYSMDSQNETEIINTGLSWPNGLDIDIKNKKIYWCDAHTEFIGSANIDGTNQIYVAKAASRGDPFDVAVHGNYLYWTDWVIKGLFRISLVDNTTTTTLRTDLFSGLNDVKFFSKAERSVPTACSNNNGGCSHFCIPTPDKGHVCACPDNGYGEAVETTDGRNCPGEQACPSIENVEEICGLRLKETCKVVCKARHHAVVPKITCVKGLVWNADVSLLCEEDRMCRLLPTPDNAKVDCTGEGYPGDMCVHTCLDNYTAVSGDRHRKCNSTPLWTGQPLVCRVKTCPVSITNGKFDASCKFYVGQACDYTCSDGYLKTTNMTVSCQFNQIWNTEVSRLCKATGSSHTSPTTGKHHAKGNIGITVGIVVVVLLLIAIIVAALFLVWRRRQVKTTSVYRESSSPDINGTSSYDTPGATPGNLSPTYSVDHGSVNLDGSIAFDNPAYGTLPPKRTEGATAAPGDVGVEVVTTPEQTACANPLFGIKEKDKTLLLDDVGAPHPDTSA